MCRTVGITKRNIIKRYVILSILESANNILCFAKARAIG
jgi:hypothetical protein